MLLDFLASRYLVPGTFAVWPLHLKCILSLVQDVSPCLKSGFFAGLWFPLCLAYPHSWGPAEASLLYTQLNTRWQPDHRPLRISPLPGSQSRPEASAGFPQRQARLVTCPAPQLQLLAAETQGKLPAAKYRPKLRRPEGFGQGRQSGLPPA